MFKTILIIVILMLLGYAVGTLATTCLAAEKQIVQLEKQVPDVDKAKAAVQAEKQERQKKCAEAIEKALKEYRCNMEIGILVTQKGNIPQVQLVPAD